MNTNNLRRIFVGGFLSILPLFYFLPFDSSPMIQVDRELPNYTMFDQEGKKVFIKEITHGKQTLIYFGYLKCKTVCRGTIARLRELLDAKGNFQLIFISLDPENDKPSHLKILFEKSESRAVLLRPANQGHALVVASELGVRSYKNIDSEEVEHQDSLIWVGPQNRIKGIFPEFQNSWDKNPKEFTAFLSEMEAGGE